MPVPNGEFDRLILGELDTLYRVARHLTSDASGAEDLVQETCLRALRAREGFEHRGFGVRPWLIRILNNIHLTSAIRRPPHKQLAENVDIESREDAWGFVGMGDEGMFDTLDDRVVRALDTLAPEYRVVLLLWAVEELTYAQIAEALEIPIGTVMSRLYRARRQIADRLLPVARELRMVC